MSPGHRDLLSRLFVELFQTEESARRHPAVEADRLGDLPPSRAMRAIAAHAARALPELERLADAEGLRTSSFGKRIGDAFSTVRRAAFDRMLDREKSYRGTLLGLRHGVDLVQLLRAAARRAGRKQVVAFSDAWLTARIPLVDSAVAQLAWFGAHPRVALEPASRRLSARSASARTSAPRAAASRRRARARSGR